MTDTREPEFCPCSHTTGCEECMGQVVGFFTTEELVNELMKREDKDLALKAFDWRDLEWECKTRGGI